MKNVQKRGINWKVLILSFIFVHIAAFLGSRFTDVGDWYESVKPSITPPNFVFPIVWTTLFILISIALYLTYVNSKEKNAVAIAFSLNLVLNSLWSYLFFGMQNPVAAFYELIFLWLSILLIIFVSWRANKLASYLLIPYLIWVSFAGVLNYLVAFG
ncbi:MAG: TspO/MBR family protein [Candidatus Pacearchaeota archaeon]